MFQIFFVIIFLFLVLCQCVISTFDSNGVSEREHIHDDNIYSDVQERIIDNVVLHYYSTPGEDGFFNVVYHTKDPENHYVYGEVFWYQTISIAKSDLDSFCQCFSRHISGCCYDSPSERASVNICHYNSSCKRDCQMFSFEYQFLHKGILGCSSSDDLLEMGRKIMEKTFFNDGRHAREKKWEDFFSVIRNRFLDLSGNQIYSEGKDVNPDFTYLYLLTNRFMYELGYNLGNKSLFLMRIDLMVLALHCKIGSGFLDNNNDKYSFEMPFDMIFDSQKERKQENILHYKNVGNIKESSQQYSEDIKRSTLSEKTMRNVRVAKKNKCKSLHVLNNEKDRMKTHAICNSLKNSETQNRLVINEITDFEEKLWEDIKRVYNDKNHTVDFDYYKREMSLQ